jgi:Fe-S cluster assembly ATP-binding protein
MIKINNLHVSVEGQEILKGVDLVVRPGEVHAVMGKNGSGKSTLAFALAGHPKYEIKSPKSKSLKVESGAIEIDGKIIDELAPNERAEMGLFLANQYPAAVPGLGSTSFLWQIYKKKNQNTKNKTQNTIQFRAWIEEQAKALDLNLELLKRGLNDGFSGGEKKKMEILQMLVSNPKYVVLDEIDSGLDVEALKKIATTVAKVAKVLNIGVIIITHYSRLLKYIKVDRVHIMEAGVIKKSGDSSLIEKIENTGFGDNDNRL